MATATKATTTPRRSRAKAAPPATTATATAVEETDVADTQEKVGPFELSELDPSKNYARFDISKDTAGNDTGCVGTFYAPPGTVTVKIVYYGPNGE
jgi:hypothetical protein